MESENRRQARFFWDKLVNRRNISELAPRVHELLSFSGGLGDEKQGLEGLKAYSLEMLTVMPDFRVEFLELMDESEEVMVHLRFRGTQQGMLLDTFHLGLELVFDGVAMMRFSEGLLLDCQVLIDIPGLQIQLKDSPKVHG